MAFNKKKYRKVLWAIAVVVALPVLFNVLSVFMGKRYTAEMRLLVDETTQTAQESGSPLDSILDISQSARPRSPQTQLDILTGTIVLQDALQMASERLPNKIHMNSDASALYENLVRRLQVENEVGSDILTVKVTEDDPEVAAELANDIGLSYIDYSKRLSKEAGSKMSDQLQSRITALQAKLRNIDAAIGKVKAQSNVYDITAAEANVGASKENADHALATAQAAYEGGAAQLAAAELQLKEIPEYINVGTHTQINPLVITLEQTLATERANLAQLRAQYQDNFPSVKEERQKIAGIEQQLKSATLNIQSGEDRAVNPVYQSQLTALVSLRSQIRAYAGQLAVAQAEQKRASTALYGIPKAEQQLQALIRDRTVTEQTYQQLEQRETIIQGTGMARQPSSQVVSTAIPPSTPSFPDHRFLTLVGLALGVFFAVLILMPRSEALVETSTTVIEPLSPVLQPSVSASLPEAPKRAPTTPRLSVDELDALTAAPKKSSRSRSS